MLQLLPEEILRHQVSPEAKKLVSVSATSTLVTGIREEAVGADETARFGKDGKESKGEYLKNLAQVPYIRYPIIFWKKSIPVLVLFDSGSEGNAIHLTLAKELSLFIRPADVKTQKIDSTTLDIY